MNALTCAVLALLLVMPAFAAEEPAADDAPSVLVATIAPVQGKLEQPIVAYGVVQAAPGGSLAVASLHAAQVLQLRVVAGQVVTKGEAMLDLGADPSGLGEERLDAGGNGCAHRHRPSQSEPGSTMAIRPSSAVSSKIERHPGSCAKPPAISGHSATSAAPSR